MKRQRIRKAAILISFLLFPVTINFLSPYLIVDGAAQGIVTGSFIIFSLMLAGSIFGGRIFCSWICPTAALQEYCFGVNNKKVRGKIVGKIKYFIWAPWIISIISAFAFSGGIKEVNFLYLTETGISVDAPIKYITYFSVLALFIILSLTVGKRGTCHAVCWMSPFMILGSKVGRLLRIPALHLEAKAGKCSNCKACEAKCLMSLEVNKMVTDGNMAHNECILCGECMDNCPKKVIYFSIRKG